MFAHRFKRYESDNATTPLIKSALVFVSPSVGDKLNELSLMDEREYLLFYNFEGVWCVVDLQNFGGGKEK